MQTREISIYKFRASFTSWVTLCLLVVSFITYVVALGTPAWGVTSIAGGRAHVVSGLWVRCNRFGGHEECRSLVGTDGTSNLLVSAQCISVLGLVVICLALITVIVYIFVQVFRKDERVALLLALTSFLAGGLIVITCVTFTLGDQQDVGVMVPRDPDVVPVVFGMSYSFGLAIFTAMMVIASGGFITFELATTKHMIPR